MSDSARANPVAVTEAATLVNPLREGLTIERAAEPCAMVIMGAHGDLTKRKLIPALYALFIQGLLPEGFCIVGQSRTAMSHEQFRAAMLESMRQFAADVPLADEEWRRFAACLYYLPADFARPDAFQPLAELLAELAGRHGTQGNNIFYLSIAPSLYVPVIHGLSAAGLAASRPGKQAPWPRIVVEKPFGHDLQSAQALDHELHGVFGEHQIFRIDHYLGKETVQNIMVLRFANGIFEPLWNRQHIEHIQITNAESIGIEGRGSYYEEAGNLRDMVQNHMLQLVSLVAMEPPISLDAEATRDERTKVLKAIRPFNPANLDQQVVRGQYGPGWILGQKVPGYRQEPKVSPESRTETFSALKLFIDNWRWADVPFYVRSGKRLGKSITEIAIQFRRAPHKLFRDPAGDDQISPNMLVLQIQPDEGISLKFATKQPGPTTQIRWLSMDFRYGTAFAVRTPSAYERLLLDCLVGDASLFARTDQVEVAWALIDPVLRAWNQGPPPAFPDYSAGSWGPPASDRLIEADGFAWRRL
ncbi:MAG TPA: glucose-6-phosphate dehydrogenase [Candidatus Obscuribacterales bacterium]